ncbi:MAG: lipase family alpha/beta hydrolase [Bacillota bacterium]
MRRQLSQLGLSYNDEHFLSYSYTGGKVQDGRWLPNPYSPADTGQPIEFSVMYLREMIKEFSHYHPRARFLLIGHSLGGRIAFDYVNEYHLERPESIKGVITLNSPLIGTPYTEVDLIAAVKPIFGTPAVRQLAAEYQLRNELDIQKRRMEAARKLTSEGIYLATFGTRQDVIVHPFSACLTDKQGKPLTKGHVVSVSIFPSAFKELFGHSQILTHEEVVESIVSIYSNPLL